MTIYFTERQICGLQQRDNHPNDIRVGKVFSGCESADVSLQTRHW